MCKCECVCSTRNTWKPFWACEISVLCLKLLTLGKFAPEIRWVLLLTGELQPLTWISLCQCSKCVVLVLEKDNTKPQQINPNPQTLVHMWGVFFILLELPVCFLFIWIVCLKTHSGALILTWLSKACLLSWMFLIIYILPAPVSKCMSLILRWWSHFQMGVSETLSNVLARLTKPFKILW